MGGWKSSGIGFRHGAYGIRKFVRSEVDHAAADTPAGLRAAVVPLQQPQALDHPRHLPLLQRPRPARAPRPRPARQLDRATAPRQAVAARSSRRQRARPARGTTSATVRIHSTSARVRTATYSEYSSPAKSIASGSETGSPTERRTPSRDATRRARGRIGSVSRQSRRAVAEHQLLRLGAVRSRLREFRQQPYVPRNPLRPPSTTAGCLSSNGRHVSNALTERL